MTWTRIELDLMEVLSCKVRILSLEQACRIWSEVDVRKSISRLSMAGLLELEEWSVQLPPVAKSPTVIWRLNEAQPDAWKLSKHFRKRWNRNRDNVTILRATAEAGLVFGGRTEKTSRSFEQGHDLLLSEVYILYRIEIPKLAACWIGEAAMPLAPHGVKNPDAFLFDESLVCRRVVESAGAYSQYQVETFHRYCVEARLPYELW